MLHAITLRTLRLPVDTAIGRVEQLITETRGEQWAEAEMLQQLACLYAYAGRFAEARAARDRGRSLLAEALYAQRRFDEALHMTEETARLAPADDVEPQARYRAVKAKTLARLGQLHAAALLCDEAVARARPTSKSALLAEMMLARAEVSRLAGAAAESASSLQQALQIYQQRGAVPLADRVRAMLADIQL